MKNKGLVQPISAKVCLICKTGNNSSQQVIKLYWLFVKNLLFIEKKLPCNTNY